MVSFLKSKKGDATLLTRFLIGVVLGVLVLFGVANAGEKIAQTLFNFGDAATAQFQQNINGLSTLPDREMRQYIFKLNKDSGILIFNRGAPFLAARGSVEIINAKEHLQDTKTEIFKRPDAGDCSTVDNTCACFVSGISYLTQKSDVQNFISSNSKSLKSFGLSDDSSLYDTVFSFNKYSCTTLDKLYFSENTIIPFSVVYAKGNMMTFFAEQPSYNELSPFSGGLFLYTDINTAPYNLHRLVPQLNRQQGFFAERYQNTLRICANAPCFSDSEKRALDWFNTIKNNYNNRNIDSSSADFTLQDNADYIEQPSIAQSPIGTSSIVYFLNNPENPLLGIYYKTPSTITAGYTIYNKLSPEFRLKMPPCLNKDVWTSSSFSQNFNVAKDDAITLSSSNLDYADDFFPVCFIVWTPVKDGETLSNGCDSLVRTIKDTEKKYKPKYAQECLA